MFVVVGDGTVLCAPSPALPCPPLFGCVVGEDGGRVVGLGGTVFGGSHFPLAQKVVVVVVAPGRVVVVVPPPQLFVQSPEGLQSLMQLPAVVVGDSQVGGVNSSGRLSPTLKPITFKGTQAPFSVSSNISAGKLSWSGFNPTSGKPPTLKPPPTRW